MRRAQQIPIFAYLTSIFREKLMDEIMCLENLQGLYLTTSSGFPQSYLVPDPHAPFMVHIWMKGKKPATLTASKSGYLRLLTLATSAPFDDRLATTLITCYDNHHLLARFQPVVRKLFRCDIVADDRVTVAVPAIDYDRIGVTSISESEASILAALPDVVTRNVPLDLAGNLRYLAMAVKTSADVAVLPRLAQMETLKLYLLRGSQNLVEAALKHILLLKSIKSLSIRETNNIYDTTSGTQPVLHPDDIEAILQSLTGLTELEIPIYTGLAVSFTLTRFLARMLTRTAARRKIWTHSRRFASPSCTRSGSGPLNRRW